MIPFTIDHDTVTLHIPGEDMPRLVDKSHKNFTALRKLLVGDQPFTDEDVIGLSTVERVLMTYVEGKVQIDDAGKVTYAGLTLNGAAVDVIAGAQERGDDVKPWLRLLEKTMDNPDARILVDDLFEWIRVSECPIADDGDILGFKYVGADGWSSGAGKTGPWTDSRGRVHYEIGKSVEMPRSECSFHRDSECGSGLHFGNRGYTFGGELRLLVKVDPRDITSVPAKQGKGLCCKMFCVKKIDAYADVKKAGIESGLIGAPLNLPKSEAKPKGKAAKKEAKARDIAKNADNFDYKGKVFTRKDVIAGVKTAGQRAWALANSVPRTTLQGWIDRINGKNPRKH